MNGRLYDPVVGRFFSPDPYGQAPDFTQNFNRYSYCLNNPLMYTDPSGEFIFTALMAPIGLAPIGVILDGMSWAGLVDMSIQFTKMHFGLQGAFNFAELGGSMVGGGVFAGLGLVAPALTAPTTSFWSNVPTYLGRAGYAGATGIASAGSGMLAADYFDNRQINHTGEEYLKTMGFAGLVSVGTSFASSVFQYFTWDKFDPHEKLDILSRKFDSRLKIDWKLVDEYGYFKDGVPYIGIKTLDDKRASFLTAKHEVKHLLDYLAIGKGKLNLSSNPVDQWEVRAYKTELLSIRLTSKIYLENLYNLRYDYGFKGISPIPNPFSFFNSIF